MGLNLNSYLALLIIPQTGIMSKDISPDVSSFSVLGKLQVGGAGFARSVRVRGQGFALQTTCPGGSPRQGVVVLGPKQ